MKKIGFIDYFIDEWHADNYPEWIRQTKRDYDVHLAWEETTPEGLKPLAAWCDEQRVNAAESIEQVVDECEALIVLAPSNPEVHERLSELPLKSGKPVYIDKPFATDRATAERLFALAEKHQTPMMTSSALRFGDALQCAVNDTHKGIKADFASIRGGGTSFEEYAIHQLEMLVMLMGTGATRIKQCGNQATNHLLIDYNDGRRATMTLNSAQGFGLSAFYDDQPPVVIHDMSGFWDGFINSLLTFFDTGKSCVDKEQTLEIVSLLENGCKAKAMPDEWLTL